MSERRSGPSSELVYSEQDLAKYREQWIHDRKEEELGRALSEIKGFLGGLPDLVRTIARQVVLEVQVEQKKEQMKSRREDLRFAAGLFAVVVLIVVPIEEAILRAVIR